MQTRAAVSRGPGTGWEVTTVELAAPRAGEAVVKMVTAGVCHSDDHYDTGDSVLPEKVVQQLKAAGQAVPEMFPLIGGHEGAGVVVEVGPGVSDLAVGDHVAVSFIPACGRCRWCATGQSYICDRGAELFSIGMVTDGQPRRFLDGEPVRAMMQVGTFSEHIVAATDSLIRIEPELPFSAGSLVSCGVTTGWGAAVNRAGTRPGETVVVIGVGGVGINAVQGAKMAGARHVVAVDPLEFKRESALRFGATHAVASSAEAIRLVQGLTRGAMAERVIVTPGVLHAEIMTGALALTGKGGTCVPVAITPLTETSVPFSLAELVGYCKEIKGCLYGNLNPREAMPRLLQLYADGELMLDELVTTTYRLEDIGQAFADLRAGTNIRGVIAFD
ncbi:NDMA-dependent alcohol dehydrogenase [Nocardioides sp. Iso805N]|uniref:NDMA-dependent alcohol dehydrogenase n=1 Tax=Nocardioides sp. Iso805N TaxID=1283287 RepID=UPI000476C154|nr:NDMA-dependent alcohol dehydrogenase [Nocardioides sp. Iso805N]